MESSYKISVNDGPTIIVFNKLIKSAKDMHDYMQAEINDYHSEYRTAWEGWLDYLNDLIIEGQETSKRYIKVEQKMFFSDNDVYISVSFRYSSFMGAISEMNKLPIILEIFSRMGPVFDIPEYKYMEELNQLTLPWWRENNKLKRKHEFE